MEPKQQTIQSELVYKIELTEHTSHLTVKHILGGNI